MLNELYQSLDPIAFSIGPFTARWYGLAYVAGFLCAIAIMYIVGKRWKMRFTFDPLCIVLLCAMIGVIVGGRLGYVLFYNFEMYAANPLAWRICGCRHCRGSCLSSYQDAFFVACRSCHDRSAYRLVLWSMRQFCKWRIVGCAD